MFSISTVLWMKYALAIDSIQLTLLNGLGLLCTGFFLGVFYYFSPNKAILETRIIAALTYVSLILFSVRMGWMTLSMLGMAATFGSLVALASPLGTVMQIVERKDSSSLSLPLIAMSLVSSSAWLAYGWRQLDPYITIPNLIGFFLSAGQLGIYLAFRKDRTHKRVQGISQVYVKLEPLSSMV